jgi:hypothetical protein
MWYLYSLKSTLHIEKRREEREGKYGLEAETIKNVETYAQETAA